MSHAATPLAFWTIAELQAAYRARLLSPVEATDACLARIAEEDPGLHAFLRVEAAGARRQAALPWDDTRPLRGVPYSLKDNMDVAGWITTCHTRLRADHRAVDDSEVQRALSADGAVLLGKNSLHELATGGPSFDLAWPPARHPWDRSRHPGGSSSGSAVAVATGMAAFSLGTDTSGSVRHPATACGVYGYKPGYGAISLRGVVPLSPGFDHVGPLTRGARDQAIVMSVLAERGDERAAWAALATDKRRHALGGYRVGVIDAFSTDLDPDPHIARAFDEAVADLQRAGCTVTRVRIDTLALYTRCARTLSSAQAYAEHGAVVDAHPDLHGARTRARFAMGRAVTRDDYARCLDEQRRLTAQMALALADVDVAVSLSSLHDPCAIDDVAEVARTYDRQARTPFNLTGMPAISVPRGLSPAGLPMGLHLSAGAGRDAGLIAFVMAMEDAGLCGYRRPPEPAPQ